jgi:hypothetical protein
MRKDQSSSLKEEDTPAEGDGEDDNLDDYTDKASIIEENYELRRHSPVQDTRMNLHERDRDDEQDSFRTSSSVDWEKKRRQSMRKVMKRDSSDVSVI